MDLNHIVVNVTEHDAMHARLMLLKDVNEVAAAGVNEQIVALVWECPDYLTLTAQAEILWNELIPAVIVNNNEDEIRFVNSIIDSCLNGAGF